MSSISLLPGLLKGGSLTGTFQSQSQMMRKRAEGDSRAAAAGALTRSLLQNAANAQGSAPGTLPTTTGGTGNPLTANLGNLIDLKATMVHAVDDTSLTIKTAEGDTITLTSHSEVNALKAKLTYAPADAPAGTPANAPQAAEGHEDHDGDDDDHRVAGNTKGTLREIQIDNRVSLSVEGDLSEEELADIKKLVASLGDSLEALGSGRGDDDHAENGSQSLTKLDTQGFGSLAGFELHAERTVEVTRIHMKRLPVAPPPAVVPMSDPTIAPGKGSINTTPVAAPVTPATPATPATPGRPRITAALYKAPRPAPGATPAPATPANPATPAPKPATPEAAWDVSFSHTKTTTVAEMLRNWTTPAAADKPKGVLDPSGSPAQDTPVTTRP